MSTSVIGKGFVVGLVIAFCCILCAVQFVPVHGVVEELFINGGHAVDDDSGEIVAAYGYNAELDQIGYVEIANDASGFKAYCMFNNVYGDNKYYGRNGSEVGCGILSPLEWDEFRQNGDDSVTVGKDGEEVTYELIRSNVFQNKNGVQVDLKTMLYTRIPQADTEDPAVDPENPEPIDPPVGTPVESPPLFDPNVAPDGNAGASSDNPVNHQVAEEPYVPVADCYTSASELGWILCPIITALGETAEYIYEKFIVPSLKVDPELFTLVSDNPDATAPATYDAWTTFQSFANVAFVIFLLIIIFSQITGIGIDNYGIKKSLPKLIIAALLINLSYIVCQLAVDVSNILGYGLRALFVNIASGISVPAGGYTGTGIAVGAVSTAVTLLVGALTVSTVLSQGIAIILPLALALFTAVIAIIFFFILLGVRQAGVVLLTVLAPLAIVCYMLPNTKSMFDRWRKMFTGLLLLFPICGLMIGAGELASRILLSANPDNFASALVAMLINVVPFFFVPTLLKNSFAAVGNIGAKISGLGNKLGKGTADRVRKSEGYRQRRNKLAAAKDGSRREALANSKFGILIGARGGMARARGARLKDLRDFGREEDLAGAGYEAEIAKIGAQREEQNIENEEALLQQAINKRTKGFTSDDELINTMHNSKNRNQQYAIARHLAGYRSGAKALSKYASGGYRDGNNNVMTNTFGASGEDRQQFASAMMGSKNFGKVGDFSPDLEEYIVKITKKDDNGNDILTNMADSSASVNISASKVATATEDSLQRMWDASETSPTRRKQLVDAMTEAMQRGSATAGIVKGNELTWMKEHVGGATTSTTNTQGTAQPGQSFDVQNTTPPPTPQS